MKKRGLSFKGGIPVNHKTIEERMGVRTRRVAGEKKDSIVNLSQIRTIDKKRLKAPRITKLSDNAIKKVDEAIMSSLGLR